ncbi:UNVERIFIED_CONTAM: hypothetical protein RMT77_002399 [Armadillidium vulgare]
MFRWYILLGLLIVSFKSSFAFPTGAPIKACFSMTPRHHNHTKQNSPAPYVVEAIPSGREVTVTLKSTTAAPFLGFLLRAVDSNDVTVGQFVKYPATAKTLTCNSTDDSVTHNSKDPKYEQEFLWRTTTTGSTVVFRATFVQTYETFWVDVRSDPITV